MLKFNIPRRPLGKAQHLGKANHCKLSQKMIRWLNGELLGDGCLVSYSIHSANFVYGSKYLEYIYYIRDILQDSGIKIAGKIYKKEKGFGIIYAYRSLSYPELLPIRKRWYPNGKKIVPENIKLTPLTCRQWYIGDGCLENPPNRHSHIRLCTDAFNVYDIKILVEQLNTLGFKTTRQANNRIYISSYSTKDFLDYIGSCPTKCYQYKWNLN